MSMTKEEAIKCLEEIKASAWGYHIDKEVLGTPYSKFIDIVDFALAALRGPTREMVERMRGEWELFGGKYLSRKKCSRCGWDGQAHIKFYLWCPACGAPMTDEAVAMMLEKWKEALSHVGD